ncbi:MAG: hypothetical protein OXE77_12050, partial [Flavobacteriaceae bacterium]|nr:hypothetical protein [Flavobacteriaceae bacterium]MCY4267634.1 hypothetical protein [Flavobacteriaceae bacterium]
MYKMPVWFLWSLFDVKIEKASKPKIFLQIAKHHAVQIKNIAYLNEEYVVIELIDEEKKSRTIKVLKSEIIIMGSNSKDSDLVAHVIDQLIDRLKRINVKNPLLWELYAYFDKGLFGLGLAV